MMDIPTLHEVSCEGKRVLLRAEFNVPIKDGRITDDRRIAEAVPTIRAILADNAKQLILIAHLGRPEGKSNPEFSLKPVAARLQELLGLDVLFLRDCVDVKIPETAKVVLLENLRFHKEEEKNDAAFAKKLAKHGDLYVNDAFGNMHRSHASIVALPRIFPDNRCVGLLVEKELRNLDFSDPERPFVAVLGCAKISDKITLLNALLERVDKLLLGGAIVFTFLKARGFEVGTSLCEEDKVALAQELLDQYPEKIVLPADIVISEGLEEAEIFTVDVDKIPSGMKGLDIGDETIDEYELILDSARTVFWNGPVGVYETPPFDAGTHALAEHLAKSKAKVVVGGGDTAAAVDQIGVARFYEHVSTGGGASLQLVAGEKLPGVEVFRE